MLDRFPDPVADADSFLSPSDRARVTLLDDYTLSDREAALISITTPAVVARVRRTLIEHGVIPPKRLFHADAVEPRIEYKQRPAPPRSLRRGLCVDVTPERDLWTSDDWHERQRAIEICNQCPVIGVCQEYSLSLPAKDTAIWGGLTAMGRDKLRRKRDGRPPPPAQLNSNVTRNARRAARREAEAAQQAQAHDQQAQGGAA